MPPVAGSLVWLDAGLGTYQDVAGTIPADDDAEVVGLWQDQSGNANHFRAAADNTTRPVLKTNIVNSLPVIRADGTNDRLYSVGNLTLTTVTVHLLMIPTAASEDRRILYQYDGVDYWFLNNSITNTMYQGHPLLVINGCWTLNAPTIVTLIFDSLSMSLRVNGALIETKANTAQETIAALNMFASATPGNFAHVDMAELLIYDSALSGANVDTNESYLATRYDVTLETNGTQLLWLKSDTEIYQEIAATNPAVADNDTVGYWKDQSGKGNNVTSVSDGTQRPTIQTDQINAYPVVRFDGVNDYLRTISEFWLREFTISMVVSPREYGDDPRVIYQYDGADGWHFTPKTATGFYNISPAQSTITAVDTFGPNLVTLERGADYIAFRRNGQEVGRTALASLPTTVDEIFLAADRNLASTAFHDGDYAELIIRRGVNTTNRDADESYLATRYDIPLVTTDPWEELTAMTAAKGQFAFEEMGGKLYAVSGLIGTSDQDTVYAYDPVANSWATLAVLPASLQSMVMRAVGGKLYCIGGLDNGLVFTKKVYEYDPVGDSWATKTDMPTVREEMGSAVYDGKIYVFGGLTTGFAPTAVMEVYNPSADTWDETKADLPAAKWSGDHGEIVGGKIYAVGSVSAYAGYPAMTPIYTVYRYDPVGDAWSAVALCPGGTSYKDVATDGTYLYIAAGTTTRTTVYSRSVYRYDPAADEWQYLCAVPYVAQGATLLCYDGALYLCGGDDGTTRAYLYKLTLQEEPPPSGGRVWVCFI